MQGVPVRAMKIADASDPNQCVTWHRAACASESILSKVPLLLSFTRNNNRKQFPLPAPLQDIASFLLVVSERAFVSTWARLFVYEPTL